MSDTSDNVLPRSIVIPSNKMVTMAPSLHQPHQTAAFYELRVTRQLFFNSLSLKCDNFVYLHGRQAETKLHQRKRWYDEKGR